MSELLLIPVALVGAIVVGTWLYSRNPSASSKLGAFFAMARALFIIAIGIALMFMGTVGLVLGFLTVAFAVYLGSGHAERAGFDVRSKMMGGNL